MKNHSFEVRERERELEDGMDARERTSFLSG